MTALRRVAFLLARIAEDEAAAQTAALLSFAAKGELLGHWAYKAHPGDPGGGDIVVAGHSSWCITHDDKSGAVAEQHALHIARHDPARVLAECKAKRAIIEYTAGLRTSTGPEWTREVRILAAVYADHPDYDGGAA